MLSFIAHCLKIALQIFAFLFNKNIVEKNNKVNFVPIIILFTIALLIQLFTLDFSKFSQNIDYVHDGMLLTP